MFIVRRIPSSRTNSIDVQLEHDGAVLDPRIIIDYCGRRYKFRFSVKGRILTITRIDRDGGWDWGFFLRAYLLPTEDIPDFASTVYTYYGLLHEKAPKDTTKVIFHPSVTIIQRAAFSGCKSLVRVTIPETVTRIDEWAFYGCDSLRFIRLSTNLEFIEMAAFCNCKSVESVFLPPTVNRIHNQAFYYCTALRFCILPESVNHVVDEVFKGCDQLSTTVSNNLS